MVLFTAAVTPIRVAFQMEGDTWQGLEYFTDCVFLFDIVFTFRAAFYNNKEELIDSPRQIACSYLRGWFAIDLISILPVSTVFRAASLSSLGKLARLPRLYKIFKTVK